jgi:hypothetical protein
MKQNRFLASIFAALLITGTALAQNSSTPSGPVSSGTINDAFQIARPAVKPEVQDKVVSCYGIGTPSTIQKWYIIFYDPTVPSRGRAVLVENSKITKTYPANGGKTYSASLAFDPSRITSEGPALSAAQNYAAKHHIRYDSVTALLNQTSATKPFRWQIGLLENGSKRGIVYVNALDDTVASYSGPAAVKKSSSSSSSDNSGVGFANDVKSTFLGIGGDLQQFFTGERTVDK